MRRFRPFPAAVFCAAATLAAGLVPWPLAAQTPSPATIEAPAPYQPVAAKPPDAHGDPGFAAFRRELADVARGRIFAELARIVVASGFFWERDFGGAFDSKRSAAENLAAAIGLERNDGAGWQWLGHVAQEAGADPMPSHPGVICAPARPKFDAFEFYRIVEATQTKPADWVYARAGNAEVRAQPRERSAVADKIGAHFVRILGYEANANDADPARTAWARVATPAGKAGYVAPGKLVAAFTPQLCYTKDALARWRITGFVGMAD